MTQQGPIQTEEEHPSQSPAEVPWPSRVVSVVLFFPILLWEKATGRRLAARHAWGVYLVLGLGALAGAYDILFGVPAGWIYGQAIEYSDRSVINSLIALGVVQAAQWVTVILPPLSAVIGEISEWIVRGVAALAMQSAFLRLVQAGFLLKYFLGAGLLLGVFKATEQLGLKLATLSLMVFITLPLVITAEALLYAELTARLNATLAEDRKRFGSIAEIATDTVMGQVTEIRKYWNRLAGNADEARRLEKLLAEKPKLKERLRGSAKSLFHGLVTLLLLTLFTCLVVPLLAYWVLFKATLSLLGEMGHLSLRAREAPAAPPLSTPP